MKKWRGLSDEKADEELAQIQLEQSMFEDSNYSADPFVDVNESNNPEEGEGEEDEV